MMDSDLVKRSSQNKYSPLSATWRSISWSRFSLCLIVLVFTLVDSGMINKKTIFASIAIYCAFHLFLGFISSNVLQLKRVRLIFSLIDVVFVSLIIFYTGGPTSSWFVIYLFPLISIARYLGIKGSLALAAIITVIYFLLYVYTGPSQGIDLSSLLLRCLLFWGMAAVAGNLAKSRQVEEIKLVGVFEEINGAILSNVSINQVFELILKKALEFTRSEMGHIRLINKSTGKADVIAAIGHPKDYKWDMRPLIDSYSQQVINSRAALFIPSIKKINLRQSLGAYFRLYRPRPKSALFVPLVIRDTVVGIIAVYSRRRFHYTQNELISLKGFIQLIAIAQNNAELYRELTSAARERQERLKLLNELGVRLESGADLRDLFSWVVALTYDRLNAEDVALFVPENGLEDRIIKVAELSPSEEITRRLGAIETSYISGEGVVGSIFQTKNWFHLNVVHQDMEYMDDYKRI